MRIGIVGCGKIGALRARVSLEAGDTVAVVADADPARARALAAEVGARAVADPGAVAAADVDAVVVATPNRFLLPAAAGALEAGRHVLCEKPMGRSLSEAEGMAFAARKAGRVLRVGFNHRFHPALAEAHERSRRGELGPLYLLRGTYGHGGRPGYEKEWRGDAAMAGGGELLDQGVHLLDLARWFLGDFEQAYALAATYHWPLGSGGPAGGRLEDNAFALLRTPSGQVASLHASWTQWKNLFCLDVVGRDGAVRAEGLGGSYGPERLIATQRAPEGGAPRQETSEYPGADPSWAREWEVFRAECQGSGTGNAGQGVEAMRLVDALYRSAASGSTVRVRP